MRTRTFGRSMDHRLSLMANLATSLVLYERVRTTTAKAKDVRSIVERWINTGKGGGLIHFRRLLAEVADPKAAKKVMEDLAPRYKGITGGYLSMVSIGPRRGDGALMSIIELRAVAAPAAQEKSTRKPPVAKPGRSPKKPVKRVTPKTKARARKR